MKFLIDESPLTFQPSLAEAIGLNEAIALQQVQYWISNPKNEGYLHDGYKWVYNSYDDWKKYNFPFWSKSTIQRTFSRLEELKLLVSIQPMKDRYDHTKYYRVTDDVNLILSVISKRNDLHLTETTTETTDSRESLIPVVEESFEFLQEIQEEEKPKKTERDTTQKPDLGFHTSAELILSEMLVAHYTALGRRVPKAWANPMQRDLFNRYASGMTESTLKSYLETQFARKPALADISVNIKNWVSSGNKKKSGHKEETLREKWEREGRI